MTISDADLNAYVDGQLDLQRRMEIEEFLSLHPSEAARAMAQLKSRSALRTAMRAQTPAATARTQGAARRLTGVLRRHVLFTRLRPVAVAAAFTVVGLCGGLMIDNWAPGPSQVYLAEAAKARETSLVRAGIASIPEASHYNSQELSVATGLVLPNLPASWRVKDVQVYPSDFGTSIEMNIATDRYGEISLFAARPGDLPGDGHELTSVDERSGELLTTTYWQIDDMAYALVSADPHADLSAAATTLNRGLRPAN
jgi:anti-sigma factor RsiW